jgi:hypothetical protein
VPQLSTICFFILQEVGLVFFAAQRSWGSNTMRAETASPLKTQVRETILLPPPLGQNQLPEPLRFKEMEQ